MCSADGGECEVANPGVDVVLDKVPYQAILETLPIQLAGGTGPDLAFVTDLGGLNQYYLDLDPYVDRAYWEDTFGGTLDWYRVGDDDNGIYGLHTGLTITGAYINRTLFDQAGVAVPSADADWDTWAAAAREVAEKTGTTFPMAMDRSGHRIAGPAISYGAQYFDENGDPMLVDEGFKAYIEKFVGWNNDGTMAKDVWGGQGGSSYQGHPNNRAMFNITVQRVTQAVVGELTIDQTMEKISDDLAAAMAEAN